MKRTHLHVLVGSLIGLLVTPNVSLAYYNPGTGRWLGRDPVEEGGGVSLYQAGNNQLVGKLDVYGMVTLDQLNAIAQQLGLTSLADRTGDATALIKQIQTKIGMKPDPNGNFGPQSVAAYESWAQKSGKPAVKLRDSKTAQQVLQWIATYWPHDHKCAKQCPAGYGELLALIHLESMDYTTSQGGTPLNAIGGPYSQKKVRTTAVGLAQITEDTAGDAGLTNAERYDGEKSIKGALKLIFQGAGSGCDFEKGLSLGRWQVWTDQKATVQALGKKINDLIKKKGGLEKVTNEELNAILGIK